MTSIPQQFATRIQEFTSQVPEEFIHKIVTALHESTDDEWKSLRAHVVRSVPLDSVQEKLEDLLDFWYIYLPEINADGLALALLTAIEVNAFHRQYQKIDLVWTGPESQIIPFRRTDQALLQLINSAEMRILVVSFTVYKAKDIVDALIFAGQRGVSIKILVESREEDTGKLDYDPIQAFGPEIHNYAEFYNWPMDNRPLSPDGRHGSLHAKVAVADGQRLFISSANLTGYAMNLNMEMGVLIEGGTLPGNVETHFEALIDKDVVRRIYSI
jgi:phosphatidylserine/phosphatidylglycerophosphate/cardiolipin synthase-like enzyme